MTGGPSCGGRYKREKSEAQKILRLLDTITRRAGSCRVDDSSPIIGPVAQRLERCC